MKPYIRILVIIIFCNMFLSSCTSSDKSQNLVDEHSSSVQHLGQQQTEVSESTSIMTPNGDSTVQLTGTPGKYITPTFHLPTKSPTLTTLQEEKLVNWIKTNHGCTLPCVLGIVVNQTTIQESLSIIRDNYP